MRPLTLVLVFFFMFTPIGWLGSARALATPLSPSTIPDEAEVVGHLDVDALRKTQLFSTVGGQKAIDAALEDVPADLRPLARSVAGGVRGISFWGLSESGAVHVETRDRNGLAALLAKAPVQRLGSVESIPTYTVTKKGTDHGFVAAVGDTLVLASTAESLERSIEVLAGHAANLAGSGKLPATMRPGVFVFVTIGSAALNTIQKSARAKVLQLPISSLAIDAGETAGVVTATAHAEMGTPEALQKAKSILEGVRAMASLSDDPSARVLLDGVTITAKGLALDLVAKLPVAEIARAIESRE
jgi:hypothetical protein